MAALTRRAADVRINEVDLTGSITQNSNATACQAVVSSQGPMLPSYYTNYDTYSFDFGPAVASVSFDGYMAKDFFLEGNSLWAARACGTGFKYSGLVIFNDNAGVTKISGIGSGVANPLDPQWATIVGGTDTALYQITSRRGPGSYGNQVAVALTSQTLDQVVGGNALLNTSTAGTHTTGTKTYNVSAIGQAGEALASANITQVVGSGDTTKSIDITWSPVTGAMGYYVYGRITGGGFGRIATVGAKTNIFNDTGIITPVTANLPITNPAFLPTQTGIFQLDVYDLTISSTTPRESFTCSIVDHQDETGAQMEISQRVNAFSDYIFVESNVYPQIVVPTIKSVAGQISMTGGASGSAPTSSDINNTLNLFSNKELYVIDVLINGGRGVPVIQKNMDTLAVTRNDCVAFLDVPSASQSANSAVDFRNLTLNLNSSYSALFCSDLLESDPTSGKFLYVPPSGAMASLYARTSRIAQPWFSIAGLNRGLLNVLGIRDSYDDGEATYLFQNQVNYMRKFVGKGIPLWEQMTLYTKSSALQFLNVRFLCNILKRSTYEFLIYGLQEPGDDILRAQLKSALEDYLTLVAATRGIEPNFRVVISSANNPVAKTSSGILSIAVIFTPILAVREIQLTLVLTKSGFEVTEAELASF